MPKQIKTNAARILEKNKIPYKLLTYETDGEHKDGAYIADALGVDVSALYKTLVTRGASSNHYVFVIPVDSELDLKKAAAAAGEKKVELIPVKKLFETTGYVRGGCSPVGMKKSFTTVFDAGALKLPEITVSAGKIGFHMQINPQDLITITEGKIADITRRS